MAGEGVSEVKALAEEGGPEVEAVKDKHVSEAVDRSAAESRDSAVRYGLSRTACTACLYKNLLCRPILNLI